MDNGMIWQFSHMRFDRLQFYLKNSKVQVQSVHILAMSAITSGKTRTLGMF